MIISMKIEGLSSWQIIQQKNGVGKVSFCGTVDEWLVNPVTDEEKKASADFLGVEFCFTDEEEGRPVTEYVKARNLENGKFKCEIENIPLGGVYTLKSRLVFKDYSWGGNTNIYHIAVGDIYLITGQSNAVGWSRGYFNEPIDLNVRMYSQNVWNVASQPLDGQNYSPFVSFGKLLSKKLGYPIGLIPTAVGGSPLMSWVPEGNCFKQMKKLINGIDKIKGILWYQGCTEATDGFDGDYTQEFKRFVSETRSIFGDDKIPVITFQLNRLRDYAHVKISREGYSKIREIQRRMPEHINDLYVIPTIDLSAMSDAIHNSVMSNRMLGERTAELALDVIYHKKHAFKAPDIEKIEKIGDNKIKLIFKNVESSLDAFSVAPIDLPVRVEDENGVNEITSYEIDKNEITVTFSENVGNGAMASCQYGEDPKNIIIDGDTQLPVLCFNKFKF